MDESKRYEITLVTTSGEVFDYTIELVGSDKTPAEWLEHQRRNVGGITIVSHDESAAQFINFDAILRLAMQEI